MIDKGTVKALLEYPCAYKPLVSVPGRRVPRPQLQSPRHCVPLSFSKDLKRTVLDANLSAPLSIADFRSLKVELFQCPYVFSQGESTVRPRKASSFAECRKIKMII